MPKECYGTLLQELLRIITLLQELLRIIFMYKIFIIYYLLYYN